MTRKKKGKSNNNGISNLTNTILSILKKERNQLKIRVADSESSLEKAKEKY